MDYNTPICLRIPHKVKTLYVTNPEWAKRLRAMLQDLAVKAYEAEFNNKDEDLALLRERREDQRRKIAELRSAFESEEVEVALLDNLILAREEELRSQAQADREAREAQHRVERVLSGYGRISGLSGKDYARRLYQSGLHLTSKDAVLATIKNDYGVELNDEELNEYVKRGVE